MRNNIRERGREFVQAWGALAEELQDNNSKSKNWTSVVRRVDPEKMKVVGFDDVEVWCRKQGLGVIHGGINALRYTPHFNITTEEVDLVIDITRRAIKHFSQ